MAIHLFVGDNDRQLSIEAKKFSKSAYVINFSNFENFLSLSSDDDIVVYTSSANLPEVLSISGQLPDQDCCVFFEVLKKADKIYYRPPAKWSDHSDDFSLEMHCAKTITDYFLYIINTEKNNVDGLNLSEYSNTSYLKLINYPSVPKKQFWVTGCSITNGAAIDRNLRFSKLIADKRFNGKMVDLSKGGSSLEFQADQLLRSDIQAGDVVLWGLTSEFRSVCWDRASNQPESINPYSFDYRKTNKSDDICDETRLYKAVILCHQVTNFCQKIGAILVMVPILCSEKLQLLLHNNSCYYQLPYVSRFLDYGSDDIHPGPRQHALYADQIDKILEKVLNNHD